MSGYSPATDPTQRMAELEQLAYQKPAEIVGYLAATEDALFAALDIIDSLATGGVRSQSPPQFVDFLGGQRGAGGGGGGSLPVPRCGPLPPRIREADPQAASLRLTWLDDTGSHPRAQDNFREVGGRAGDRRGHRGAVAHVRVPTREVPFRTGKYGAVAPSPGCAPRRRIRESWPAEVLGSVWSVVAEPA